MKRLHPSLFLLGAAFLAYGLLLPQLGFYWDDLPMSWIRYQLGADAMTRYFSTNRPVWALLYQLTTRLLPHQPLPWQIFALFWRWLGAVVLWALVRRLYPERPRFALTLSFFFLLYPGFNQQWGSYLYSHFFIVLFFFLLSLLLTARGATLPALLLSALNLWMMEYFFVLELVRPFLIARTLPPDSSPRLRLVLRRWAPYLALFIVAVLSRLLIFNNQVYGFSLKEAFLQAPLATLLQLARAVLTSLWNVTLPAWALIFHFPNPVLDGARLTLMYVAVVLLVGVLFLFAWHTQPPSHEPHGFRVALPTLSFGMLMLLLAGPAFWLTGVEVSLAYPANRATLSFLLGASFLLASLLDLLPQKFRPFLALILISLAAGRQFLWSDEFRRDWLDQKSLFWQMTWRAPALQKNTIVLLNESLHFYADNSLSAALNWIYAPDNHSDQVDYVLLYPTNRKTLKLIPGIPLHYDFLAAQFNGSTSQLVAFYYDPPRCLRLLDPEIDSFDRRLLPESLMREAAVLSSTAPVLSDSIARLPVAYGNPPATGWCYYFQKADLARQLADWDTVARLGDSAFALSEHANDPREYFPFIEGYAHTEDWKSALALSRESHAASKKYIDPLLCRLWSRIASQTPSSPAQLQAIRDARHDFHCVP